MNTSPILDLLSHTALKGAVVLLMALLLGLALRRMAAARRYALWITAIATLAVLPLAMWTLPAWHVLPNASGDMNWLVMEPEPVQENAASVLPTEHVTAVVPTARAVPPTAPQIVTPPSFSWNISWQDVVGSLPVVWVIIAGMLLLRLGRSAWNLHRLEASLRPGECVLLIQAAHELGLKRMPLLLIGPSDSVPMVWGVFRPRLLLPQEFETWSAETQRGVLLHELAHLKRGDPLALWAAQWVKALHWFNPLVWLTLRQLRADQERACDDAVLRQGVRASDYAQSLLDLSRHNRLAPGLSLCALTITRPAPVEARVKAILDPKRRREGLTLRWLVGMAACALLITLPMAMLHAIDGPPLRGRILDRNGVVLAESTKEMARVYPLKALTAHVVGYTGKTGPQDATPTGRFALEKQHDAVLRKGKHVSLTLDARVQSLATRALNENIQRGAIVIMDPASGGILAYVSVPSYDPNRFIPTLNAADWESYTRDKDMPLFDRVSTSRSAPGAVFQPMTALAAFVSGKNPGTYECAPLTRGAGGGVRFANTTKICRTSLLDGAAHGPLTLEQALSKSCSGYFFQLGTETGYPALLTTAGHLGLQRDTGIFGAKSEPVMPAQEEIAKTHSSPRQLTDITTAFASGNGSAVSVLQMAVLYSALANGKVWDPTLIRNDAGQPRLDLHSLPGLPEGLARVRSALQNAVNDPKGCAHAAASAKVQIAALSETHVTGPKGPRSEVFTHHHWVGGYVPAAKPALAFALYADETSANRSADPARLGPIIRRIVEETLALPTDGSGEVLPEEEHLTPLQQAQRRFEARAAELRAIVERLIPAADTGFKVDEITTRHGQLLISGTASGMQQALAFREKVASAAWGDSLEWTFPVPRTLSDGKRVEFRILGELKLQEKSAALQFDSAGSERVRQIHQLAEQYGVLLRELKKEDGKLTMRGDGPHANAVLTFLDKIKQLEPKSEIQWDIPPPTILADESVRFEMRAVYPSKTPRASQPTEKPAAPLPTKPANEAQVRQRSDAAIGMSRSLADQWAVLKKAGLLADLPAEATAISGIQKGKGTSAFEGTLVFRFSAPRDVARCWLLACLYQSKQTEEAPLQWPDPPEAFQRSYVAAGKCGINVHCPDGKTVHVTVSRWQKPILIAPDESQQPRPAGRLAPDYQQENLTQLAPPPPTWNTSLHHLRSQVYPDEEKPLPWFIFSPVQFSFQASDPPARDFSDDNLLLSVTQIGKRADQSLLVRLPLPR
ncbi:M56 family metallopeptidase [Prosthecobacter sp.]|uniref:M56 family metallopeptidase n=1 Tax=Prosthecobacter sp. TaxID=1965333 RepID=UPI00378522A2